MVFQRNCITLCCITLQCATECIQGMGWASSRARFSNFWLSLGYRFGHRYIHLINQGNIPKIVPQAQSLLSRCFQSLYCDRFWQQVLWSEVRALGCSRSFGRSSRPFRSSSRPLGSTWNRCKPKRCRLLLDAPLPYFLQVPFEQITFSNVWQVLWLSLHVFCNIFTNHTEEKNVSSRCADSGLMRPDKVFNHHPWATYISKHLCLHVLTTY